MLCMVGEFGETSNLVKKVVRGDYKLDEVREELSEEIIDIFIYVIKLMYQLEIDVEDVYIKKMKKNEKRFMKYEK
ncbi:MazG nucleotide pyrophosphohydrolase domain-containing protein [Terrisporobacter petrolearius]|uniref:MazG nucleotide pyrophosphohydrolase domain-containing protein n=1 Tax=Terrisporobacter petrolearius TaxID=1460447 RepID=UPI003CCFEB1A